MEQMIKYLVQVQCQPIAPVEEAPITRELAGDFPVTRCRIAPVGLTIDLASPHTLAYGALKDLADLIERTLSQRGARTTAGVVYETTANRPASGNSLISCLGRHAFFGPLFTGLLGRLAGRTFRPVRPVPVMYFHWGTSIDLALTGKLKQINQMEAAA